MDDYEPLAKAMGRIGRSREWYYKNRHRPGFPVGKNVHGQIYLKPRELFAYIDSCPDNLPPGAPPATVKRKPGRPRKYAAETIA
ncbi:hypothetical protein IB262_21180 [Ensifer sp. ENS02]|uniref:hypothetical protein n=1 Tax=Ensifer sp. ENS02 TaxID=2769290 RepID=UPI0017849B6D|nr:hypothetical protein [Ensifer sp. ENS02]MBD9522412.1 hypothetical protein [Ensifer sp. ENS02]